jgi:hypothetical protein
MPKHRLKLKAMETDTYKEQNEKQNKKITLFEFFNSKLGLWILGAVFLSALPFIVEIAALSYAENQRKQKRSEILRIEIEQRLTYLENFNGQVKAYLKNDLSLAFYGFESKLLKNRSYYNFKPVFDQFKYSSLKNLLFELSITQTDSDMIDKTQEIARLLDVKDEYMARLGEFKKVYAIPNSDSLIVYEFDDETKERFAKEIWAPIAEWKNHWR